jgi:hypothetical protein
VGQVHEHHVHPNHTTSLYCSSLVSPTDVGPHNSPSSLLVRIVPCQPDFLAESKSKMEKRLISYRNLQTIYRWKALTKERSEKQLVLKMVQCASLAFKEKEIGYRDQLSDFGSDKMNWQFMRHYAGPTRYMTSLLELVYIIETNIRGLIPLDFLRSMEESSCNYSAMLAIRTSESIHNKHNPD